jgi:hypothetical protein
VKKKRVKTKAVSSWRKARKAKTVANCFSGVFWRIGERKRNERDKAGAEEREPMGDARGGAPSAKGP